MGGDELFIVASDSFIADHKSIVPQNSLVYLNAYGDNSIAMRTLANAAAVNKKTPTTCPKNN